MAGAGGDNLCMALWFHVTGCTYGTWLPGDDRSFRTRHHREHIAGDVNDSPPRGMYDERRDHARALMRAAGREPVRLSAEAQRIALDVMVESLRFRGCAVAIACLDDHHFHIVMRLPAKPTHVHGWVPDPRHSHAWVSSEMDDYLPEVRLVFGEVKRRAARALSDKGLVAPGGVWSTRIHMRRIADETHLREATAYVAAHGEDGRCAMVRTLDVASAP